MKLCSHAFSVFRFSQDSVATLIKWGGWTLYLHMYRSFVNLTMKSAFKSVDFWRSYRQKQVGSFLWPTVYSECRCMLRDFTSVSLQATRTSAIWDSNAAFYWACKLIYTRNKLILFTTSRELSHYVVFLWIMADRKVGVFFNSIVFFSFYVYIPLFLPIVSVHILQLKNETNIYLLIW